MYWLKSMEDSLEKRFFDDDDVVRQHLRDRAEHRNLAAAHGGERDRDLRRLEEFAFLQRLRDRLRGLAGRLAADLDGADERHRDRALLVHPGIGREIRLLEDGDVDHVAGAELVRGLRQARQGQRGEKEHHHYANHRHLVDCLNCATYSMWALARSRFTSAAASSSRLRPARNCSITVCDCSRPSGASSTCTTWITFAPSWIGNTAISPGFMRAICCR